MKHSSLCLFILAAIIFSSCEKPVDDRQRPVSETPHTVWLLGVQVTKIPYDGKYGCSAPGHNFSPVELNNENLPYYYRIDGAVYLGKAGDQKGPFYVTFYSAVDSTTTNQELYPTEIPQLYELDKIGSPQEVSFSENGMQGKFIIRYVD